MTRRASTVEMKIIPRFVYNPDKADRGLRAMADILVSALRVKEEVSHPSALED